MSSEADATAIELAERAARKRARRKAKGPFANAKPGEGVLKKGQRLARWIVVKKIGKPLFRSVDKFLTSQSLVGDPAVFDSGLFPWVPEFEAGWRDVRRELEGVLEMREALPTLQDLQPDQMKISWNEQWKTFVLWGFGERSDANCARCPETARLLEAIPGMTSAWFSILAAGKHIPRHSGVTKGMVRCHLGLVIPREREKCRMKVADELVVWEEGRCVLFDDSSRHEVWNDTDEERVVLLFDVERPMRWPGRVVNRIVHAVLRRSPFVRDARRNQLAWEERMRQLEAGAAAAR